MIPGSNLLNQAFRLIATQSFQYKKFISRSTNDIGLYVSLYADPICTTGSIQPVSRSLYQEYGLDFQRNYVMLYISRAVIDIGRDVAGDQLIFNRKTYEAISRTAWHGIDGWDSVLCVEVPNS